MVMIESMKEKIDSRSDFMSYKKVLTIQDISCVGQCSLTVALPIISACGLETCVLPSAVLSTHTGGFTGYTFRDLTEDMPSIKEHWVKEGIHFDAIYSSPLKRANETAHILRGERELPIVVDERIKEIGFGVLEGADFLKIRGDKTSKFASFFEAPEQYEAPEGGESFETITERACDFMAEIVEKHKNDERIMIVAHGAINKAMMRFVRKNEIKDFWMGALQKNCGVTIVKCENGTYDVLEDNHMFYDEEAFKMKKHG